MTLRNALDADIAPLPGVTSCADPPSCPGRDRPILGGVDRRAVTYEVADLVAVVTLNRPHRLNAWTGRMHVEYRSALAEA